MGLVLQTREALETGVGTNTISLQVDVEVMSSVFNGHAVTGPGSAYNNSDWNGSAGYPLPRPWDDTGHNITAATPSGTTR